MLRALFMAVVGVGNQVRRVFFFNLQHTFNFSTTLKSYQKETRKEA